MYKSSVQAFNGFIDGSIWKDIADDLEKWLDDIHDAMEDPSEILTDRQQAKLRGNAEAVRKFQLIAHMIRDNILEDQEKKEDKPLKEGK